MPRAVTAPQASISNHEARADIAECKPHMAMLMGVNVHTTL